MFKSPFIVVENFISPLLCEEIVDETGWVTPISNISDIIQPSYTTDESFAEMLEERLTQIIPSLEQHYTFEFSCIDSVSFEQITTDAQNPIQCESSVYNSGQWVKTKMIDFTAVLFLCDYNDTAPFDQEFECYGGKLEFPNHQFGFNPNRGTLVIFPSDPRFINGCSEVQAGELFQVRITITAKTPYIYNPASFPGDYTVWF